MDLKHVIPQQRRRTYGPSFDIAFSTDKSNVSRVGPTPVFSRASSGTFVNENGLIVGKTRSTTSLNPASVPVGGVAVFAVPSGSVVGWLNNSVVSVMEDTDGDDQIGAQRHVTGTLIHKTDTAITLLVTSKSGTTTLSSWFVSYRGLRIGHDPVTGLCFGSLIEESRTNTCRQSENFGTTWTDDVGLVAISVDQTTSPSGAMDADKISENTTTSNRRIAVQAQTFVSGTTYTFSCFVKSAERDFVQLRFGPTFGGQFQNFIVGGVNAGTIGSGTGATSAIQAYPNGWYRCSITATSATTGSSTITIGPQVSSTATAWQPYVGTIGSGIFVWGAQNEAGPAATSYIPTTAASTIRSADVYSVTGTDFSRFFNQTEGTLVCKATNLSGIVSTGLLGTLSITAADRSLCAINLSRTGSSNLRSEVVQGPSFAAAAIFNFTTTAGAEGNTAIAFKQDDFASSNNGSSVQTDTSGLFPSSPLNQMLIGTNGAQRMFGWISNIRYYPKRLPNSSVQTLSAIVTDTIVYNGVAVWYNGVGLIETN